jgi:hypothetical protein
MKKAIYYFESRNTIRGKNGKREIRLCPLFHHLELLKFLFENKDFKNAYNNLER